MKLTLGRYEEAVRHRAAELAPGVERVWRRDASFWGGDDARAKSVSNRLGWLDIAAHMRERAGELAQFADQVRADGFRDAVVLGMGGSSLAPEVLRQRIADRGSDGHARLHVLDTTDPATILTTTRAIDPATTLFFVSSKSGTTIEANSLFAYFHELVRGAKGERAGANFVAITDEGTPLQALAKEHGFRRCFVNPSDIGGRYSALSYFGLVPAAVAGVDIVKLLDRGVAAMEAAKAPDGEALLLGAALGELALAGRDKCTLLVSPGIASFGLWAEQLIAESTGKEGRGILPVDGDPPVAAESYGADRAFVQLRLDGDDNAATDVLAAELVAEGHPVIAIDLADAYDLGREFFRWEFAVAIAGQVLGINPFDEPNVQESKDNTNRVLREFESSGVLDMAGIDETKEPLAITTSAHAASGDLRYVLSELLTGVEAPEYVAITAYLMQAAETDASFAGVRSAVVDARGAATTLGYGPRFLHSTGQLHKGGPPRGVFLQVTAADAEDVAIPGCPFTFGQLKRAQAIGDFQALVDHGRPVVRVHLGSDIDGGLVALRDAVVSALRAT
ncbi:MAG: glucose-6-phosphate isomerase [Chloroflexi bacterium]|nr:glucose-6-phosphate isomerase [Chloroflexota bacterium]